MTNPAWILLAYSAFSAPERLAIYGLDAPGMTETRKTALMDGLARGIEGVSRSSVMTAADIESLLENEDVKDAMGCEDVTCLAEIGQAAGVDAVVSGSLNHTSKQWALTVRLVDVRRGRNLNRVSLRWSGAESELEEVMALGGELLVSNRGRSGAGGHALDPARIEFYDRAPGFRARAEGKELEHGQALPPGIYSIQLSGPRAVSKQVVVVARAGRVLRISGALRTNEHAQIWKGGVQAVALFPERVSYRSEKLGLGAAISAWREWGPIALQPRLAYGFADRDEQNARYHDLSFDLAALYVFNTGSAVAPLIGGGLGGKYLRTVGNQQQQTFGSLIQVVSESAPTTNDFGLNLLARAGLVFFRNAPAEVLILVDYQRAKLGDTDPQSIGLSLGVLL